MRRGLLGRGALVTRRCDQQDLKKSPEFHALSQRTKAPALTATLIPNQDEAEAERQPQFALARLEHDRRRHGAGVARDVAAHDQHGADLGDRAAKAGQDSGENGAPCNRKQHPDRSQPGCTVDAQRAAVLLPWLLDRAMRQGRDDRRGQHRLCDDHSAGCEQESEHAEWTRSRQDQIKPEADNDRGQAEERVRHQDQHPAAGKPANC